MSQDKKDFVQSVTHFGSLLKEAMCSRQESMSEVALVTKNLMAIKSQSKNVQLEKENHKN